MGYRISFVLIGGSDRKIHIAIKDNQEPICHTKLETSHQLVNLVESQKLPFCKICLEAYHERPEKIFAVIE